MLRVFNFETSCVPVSRRVLLCTSTLLLSLRPAQAGTIASLLAENLASNTGVLLGLNPDTIAIEFTTPTGLALVHLGAGILVRRGKLVRR